MTRIQQRINWIKMHALQEAQQPVSDPFITTWKMTKGAFTLLTQAGTYNATIDWGDGTSSTHTTGNPTHTYASAGQYQIKITGQYNGLRINNKDERTKLIAVNAWGNVGFTSFERAFYKCINLVSLPNGSITGADNVTTFEYCFRDCKNLALPTSIFNLTALQEKQPNMRYCFYVSSTANSHTGTVQPIWNYVTITAKNYCFYNCTALANYSSIPELWK